MKNVVLNDDDIGFERWLNKIVFKKMQMEFDEVERALKNDDHTDADYFDFLLDEYYYFRRILSVIADNDLPKRSCMGLFLTPEILPELYDAKEEYLGESDTDADICKYVMDYGYRQMDEICSMKGESISEKILDALTSYMDAIERGEANEE